MEPTKKQKQIYISEITEIQKKEDKTTFQKMDVRTGHTRRTSYTTVEANICALIEPKQQESLPLRIIENFTNIFIDKEAHDRSILMRDFEELQRNFEQFGIDIPADILKNFQYDKSNVHYITEKQSTQLMDLVHKNLGPFSGHILFNVRQYLSEKDQLQLLSINVIFRSCLKVLQEKLEIFLTLDQILDPDNMKVKFAVKNNLKIKLKIGVDSFNAEKQSRKNPTPDQCKIQCLSKRSKPLGLIVSCMYTYTHLNKKCGEVVQELLNLFAEKCPNLTSLYFVQCDPISDIVELKLPAELKDLTHLKFTMIGKHSTVILPKEMNNLTDLTIGYIDEKSIDLKLPERCPKLRKIAYGTIKNQAILNKIHEFISKSQPEVEFRHHERIDWNNW